MRKALFLVFVLGIAGCKTASNLPQNTNQTSISISQFKNVQQEPIKTVGLGEVCGGLENIGCKSGLMCQLTQKHIGAEGICVETVIQKNLTCSKEKKPVCGERNGIKNGYLNECEAIRHGATVVSQGLCPMK